MNALFTILIAEKEHINAIQNDNRLFFEPFLENKEIAFCCWNPEGQTLNEAVPGLLDTIGRKKDWRCIIIGNSNPEMLKVRNPFDVIDHSEIDSLTMPFTQPSNNQTSDEWSAEWKDYYTSVTEKKEAMYKSALEHPLQKLATWLCFKPEEYILNDVKEKLDASDWALEQLGSDEIKSSARLEALEREQYKKELRLKEIIRRSFLTGFTLNIARPSEILCISLRTTSGNFFNPSDYWEVHHDSEYSTFVDRNMYFDKMRFMAFDIYPKTHKDFRTDYIRFLATVLIFLSNPVPGSAMQARRLYTLEVDTDDTPLCTMVTSYDKKLSETSAVIDNEIERIKMEMPSKLTDKDAQAMFCSSQEIAVLLDESCDPDSVIADNDYGLFFDSPENEFHKWNRSYRTSTKALEYIARQQSRSVRKSIAQAHISDEISDDISVNRLTPLQIDDIKEYTDNAEDDMIKAIPPNLADTSSYMKRLSDESEKVKKIISRRMKKKSVLAISAICLALYTICFLPFLLSNTGNIKTVLTAAALMVLMLVILGVAMVITLFVLKLSVKNGVRNYNNAARSLINEIQSSLNRVSKYLSASSNVRRGHAIQKCAEKNLDEFTKGLRIRKKHKEDIRRRRAFLDENYHDYFGDASHCDETMCRPYDYDFDQKTKFPYPAPFLAGDCRQIEFICSGNYVSVPSSYVERISVRMEGLYED